MSETVGNDTGYDSYRRMFCLNNPVPISVADEEVKFSFMWYSCFRIDYNVAWLKLFTIKICLYNKNEINVNHKTG